MSTLRRLLARALSSLAKTAGVRVDANTLANSEAYNSVATEAAQRLISQFGGNKGVTASEAEQIKQIVPQLQASPQARKQLTAILAAVAQRGIDDYKPASAAFNRAIKADDPTLFDFTPVMVPNDQPVTPQPAPSGAKKPTTSGW